MPVEEFIYNGNSKEWITWNIDDQRGIQFEGGKPVIDRISVQIHLFILKDKKYETLKKNIMKSLVRNGFTYPETQIFYESDTNLKHIVFNCYTVAESEAKNE